MQTLLKQLKMTFLELVGEGHNLGHNIVTNKTQTTPCMHFQYHTLNQTQHRLLSVDRACGTVINMCIGLVKLVWLVGL